LTPLEIESLKQESVDAINEISELWRAEKIEKVKCCSTCNFHEKEGGDKVSYGSTVIVTPEYSNCNCPNIDSDYFEKMDDEGKTCIYYIISEK